MPPSCPRVVLAALLLLSPALAAAEPGKTTVAGEPLEVPEALRPWTGWVLQGHETARCPVSPNDEDEDARTCVWPSELKVVADGKGASFTQAVEVFARSRVALPGDDERWPLDVRVDGRPAPVSGSPPQVDLAPGRHVVSGRFAWDAMPEVLPVPPATGLVALTVGGRVVERPARDREGRVVLGRGDEPAREDAVEVIVHRKLTDDVPLLLTTRITLAVAGRSRELLLARVLPEGFEARSVASPLPLRFESDGRVKLQARAGEHVITVEGHARAPRPKIQRPATAGGVWAPGDEVWVYEARPDLRVADVEGAAAVDPAQTTLPNEWRALPAYAVPADGGLSLVERRRGDAQPADKLSLARELWLDFDGGGYSVRDEISGAFTRAWRLEAGPETTLGRVAVAGADQFITRVGTTGRPGVELRVGRANVQADARVEGARASLPAVGWAHDFDAVSATLHAPPGWRVLHVGGADRARGTWLERWSLLDLFLLLVTTLAVARLFGIAAGVVAFVGLVLTITESGAPQSLWLAILVGEALVRALPAGKVMLAARVYRVGTYVALAAVLVPFAVTELRRGLHPASAYDAPARQVEMLAQDEAEVLHSKKKSTAPSAPAAEPKPEADEAQATEGGAAASNVERLDDASSGVVGGLSAGGARRVRGGVLGESYSKKNAVAHDPSVVVQTGPGLPSWRWGDVSLVWNGPVEASARLSILWLPPWLNLVLAFARIGLLAALVFVLFRRPLRLGKSPLPPRPMAAAFVALIVAGAAFAARPASAAELPSKELLDDLRTRLLAAPPCAPDCVSIGRLELEARNKILRIRLDASASSVTALALPGALDGFSPATVRVDGRPAALTRDEDGELYVALAPGVSTVELEGPLPARDVVTLPLPLRPHHVVARLEGWTVEGLHEDGQVAESLQLVRAAGAGATGGEDAAPSLPAFLSVERRLELGLRWDVVTTVRRTHEGETPVVLQVPLLPGEAVTSPGVFVDRARGTATVTLAPDASEASWVSTLAEAPTLTLRAPTDVPWTETWVLDVGATWHIDTTGIPPVGVESDGRRTPTFRPWPGEEVKLTLGKPTGVPGQTLTVDGARLDVTPGARSQRASLSLTVRASRGTQHAITLPEGATLDRVAIDGQTRPVRQEGARVVLPIAPKSQHITIEWHSAVGVTARFATPALDLGVPSANAEIAVHFGDEPRWVLWASGPRLGPAVHVWSLIVILVLVGWALDRSRVTPLRSWDWVLLGLGLLQLAEPAALVVAGFFVALGWRKRVLEGQAAKVTPAALYDASQIAFVLASLVVVGILFGAIEHGLLGRPDMRVVGNGSDESLLRWYQDRTGNVLPRASVVSAPLVVYRGAMLAWALWLAIAVLRWTRWAWGALRVQGLWKPLRKPPTPAPAPSPE